MARRIPARRIKDLLEAATVVFTRQGYRRTQMSDVAQELGVAKGTLYLYVESKAALFATVLRYAAGRIADPDVLPLPIPSPPPGQLAARIRRGLAATAAPASLERALARRRVVDVERELDEIVRELFAISSEHRSMIKLMDRCHDHPEIGNVFYQGGRFAQLDLLAQYLESRLKHGHLRSLPDIRTAARFVIESVATWAVHIHWDPEPQGIDPSDAEETLVHFLLAGLLPQAGPNP
jgi:AcrR family transcriptional regulator